MQFLAHNRGKHEFANLEEQINSIFDTPEMNIKGIGAIAYSAEASKRIPFADQDKTAESIRQSLLIAGLENFLTKQTKVSDDSPKAEKELALRNVSRGMDAAVATAVALIDAKSYHEAYLNARPAAQDNTIIVDAIVPGQATSYSYDTEGYDNFKFESFRATSIISNAMNAMTNSFEDTFFKPVMISPAEQGADVTIRIPYVFNSKKRNTDGTPYRPERKLVIDAYRNRSILANTGNKVYPNVTVNSGADLVAASDVPNIPVTSNSTSYNTRPLLFNREVDILSLSTHAGLPGGASQNESDTLSPSAMLGDVYIKLTYGADSAVYRIDTTALQGSLFIPSTVGDTQELILAMRNVIKVDTKDSNKVGAKGFNDLTDLFGDLSIAPGTDSVELVLDISLSGSLFPRDGNLIVNTAGAGLVRNRLSVNGVELTPAQYTTVDASGKLSVELLGFMPKLNRTNSNLRDKGMAVDLGSTIKYRLAVPILSPITASQPTSVEGGSVGMDGLQMVRRIRNSNIGVQTMFDYEGVIRACNGTKTQHAGIGSELVTPTIVEDSVDLETKVMFLRSKGAREDVREAIAAALDQMASQLLEDSGYLATLDALYGTQSGYEFIIATSPRLHSLLMTSGDARLLGSNRAFTIVSNHDDDFKNKIYMSVRRPGETGVDPLSFGAHISLPPLVYRSPVTVREGEHSIETQLLPRELYVGTCPMLAVLTLNKINNLFTGSNSLDNG